MHCPAATPPRPCGVPYVYHVPPATTCPPVRSPLQRVLQHCLQCPGVLRVPWGTVRRAKQCSKPRRVMLTFVAFAEIFEATAFRVELLEELVHAVKELVVLGPTNVGREMNERAYPWATGTGQYRGGIGTGTGQYRGRLMDLYIQEQLGQPIFDQLSPTTHRPIIIMQAKHCVLLPLRTRTWSLPQVLDTALLRGGGG